MSNWSKASVKKWRSCVCLENDQLRQENADLKREVERLRQESGGGKGDKPPSFVKANEPQQERGPRKIV